MTSNCRGWFWLWDVNSTTQKIPLLLPVPVLCTIATEPGATENLYWAGRKFCSRSFSIPVVISITNKRTKDDAIVSGETGAIRTTTTRR